MRNRNHQITVEDEDGVEHVLPTRKEVCDACRGEGKRALGGHAFTSSEWAEACEGDDEFQENYMSGRYDSNCEACDGLRVVDVVDEDACRKDLLEIYFDDMRAEAEDRRCAAYERRMGC